MKPNDNHEEDLPLIPNYYPIKKDISKAEHYASHHQLGDVYITKVPGHDETMDYIKTSGVIERTINKLFLGKEDRICNGLIYRKTEIKAVHICKGKDRPTIEDQINSMRIDEEMFKQKKLNGKTIILFDDIITQGNSMVAAYELLSRTNIGLIICMCIAKTGGYKT